VNALVAQSDDLSNYQIAVDSLYREDQVYVGLTFNLLSNQPSGFEQNGLSAGIQAGFIRDMPINKRRNKAIGIGLGIAIETYNQNLFIGETSSSNVEYEIIDDNLNEDINRFSSYTLELPIEYRWRTSTATDYAFWRVHAGLRLGYVISLFSTFEDQGEQIRVNALSETNRFQYGPTFSFGYGAFNFQAYYGLNSLFDEDAIVDGENVNLQTLRLGIIFYLL